MESIYQTTKLSIVRPVFSIMLYAGETCALTKDSERKMLAFEGDYYREIMVSENNERERLYKDNQNEIYGRVWYSGEATKNQ